MSCNIFVVLFLLCFIAKTNEEGFSDSIHLLLHDGRISDGQPFWEGKASSNDVTECAKVCVRMKKCKSFNFDNTTTNICQMNSEIGKHVNSDKNVVNSDVSYWPSQIDPYCYDRPCGDDEICIPEKLTGGQLCSHSCFKNVRKCPKPAETLSIQPRTVGSIYTHACDRGFVGGDIALCLPTGEWNKTLDIMCSPLYGFMCETDADCLPINGICTDHTCSCTTGREYDITAVTCVESTREGCENDWFRFEGKCYLFGEDPMDWFDARELCSDRDGQLVQVDTEQESLFLKRIIESEIRNKTAFWTDLFEDPISGEDRWFTSNDTLTFTDWAPTEPNDFFGVGLLAERCTIISEHKPFKWFDYICGKHATALCQRGIQNYVD